MNKKGLSAISFLVALALFFPMAASSQARIALVIGNSEYQDLGQLKNPVNDADDMSAVLGGIGFAVETLKNADLAAMEEAIMRFGNRLSVDKTCTGFFFYAGHGVQSNGVNYLIPSRASIPSDSLLKQRAVSAAFVLETMQAAGNSLNVVILDACRNNPFSWARSGTRGLSVVGSQPPDSIIVYATSAGSVARDGTERNGLFTKELLKYLPQALEVSEVFRLTGQAVIEASGKEQVPAVYSQFFGQAYLSRSAVTSAAVRIGSLDVAGPPGALVELNGAQRGFLSAEGRLKLDGLLPGEYRVSLGGEYIRSVGETVAVTAGAGVSVTPRYEQLGRFVYTAPGAVRIELALGRNQPAAAQLEGATGAVNLAAGDYEIRAGRPDDLELDWRGTVQVRMGQTMPYQIPEKALEYSISWRIRKAETSTAELATRHTKAVESRNFFDTIRLSGFITGGISALVSGVFYFLGNTAMQSYHSASSTSAAVSARQDASLYSTLCSVSLAATGLGLATGGAAWFFAPDTESTMRELDLGIRKLAELRASKETAR